jgi:hypothetical protein
MNRAIRQTSICLKKASRRPDVQRLVRSSTLLRKHMVRAAAMSLVPSEVNDVVIHHAQMNLEQIIHVASDSASVSALGAAMTILITTLK